MSLSKLNELQGSVEKLEQVKLQKEQELSALEIRINQSKKDLSELMKLMKLESKDWVVRIQVKKFTFPWHYYGWANINQRTYVSEEIIFVTPVLAHAMMKAITGCVGCGSAEEYHLVE